MQLRPHQVRILERMQTYPKGQIIVPTGGSKTMCMIQDTAHVQQSKCGHTTVVVAPRILLAEQLCSEFSGGYHLYIYACDARSQW